MAIPSRITAPRARSSATWLVVVSKTHRLPFSSATVRGAAGMPCRVKTVISICGNARRIESASITGRPSSFAMASGMRVFMPPTSIGMIATGSLPIQRAVALTALMNSLPDGIFSRMTVGAPMIAAVTTRPSARQLGRLHDPDRPVVGDRLADHQLGDVGIAAAAGAEQRRSECKVIDVVETDRSQRTSPFLVGNGREVREPAGPAPRRGASATSCRSTRRRG